MAFPAPALLKSMERQWGHCVENSPNLVWIMTLPPPSGCSRKFPRDSRTARNNMRVGCGVSWTRRGWLHALRQVVPEFAHRAPTLSPALSRVQPGACGASLVFCSCPSYSPGSSATPQIMASVVSMSEAIEAAFCRAVRVTLVGSITPAFTRSSYCSVVALKPKLGSW